MDTTIPITIHPIVVDPAFGHEPASAYVEAFWLPTVGPTATWMWRRLAAILANEAAPVAFDVLDLAGQLGVGPPAVHRTLERLCRFELAHRWSATTFAVPTRAPRLKLEQIRHLPPMLQELHAAHARQAVPA